jgi:hypothetical protein
VAALAAGSANNKTKPPMTHEYLYSAHAWVIAAVLLIALFACGELGYTVALRRTLREGRADDGTRSQFGNIQAAVLGLVALLLAFTFSMAVARFDLRKQLVVEEANAIGTLQLRAQLLPEPQKSASAALIGRYVEARIAYARAGVDRQQMAQAQAETAAVQNLLWAQAAQLAGREEKAYPALLYTQVLNDVIDLPSKRRAAMENHVPETVIWMLLCSSALSLAVVGYGFGLGARRNNFSLGALSVLIVLVIMLILDFDRPRRGFIEVDEGAILQLRAAGTAPAVAGGSVGGKLAGSPAVNPAASPAVSSASSPALSSAPSPAVSPAVSPAASPAASPAVSPAISQVGAPPGGAR